MAISTLNEAEKSEMVVSLAALLCSDANVSPSKENLESVIKASGNAVKPYWTALFSSFLEKSQGVGKFLGKPGAGGGGSAPAAQEAVQQSAAPVVVEEEEEEIDMGGGMDMFGGGDADY
mmetsp:Transcript_19460/g.28824  ORF Transcript_19460/g.28824 Transcript_19460/m.28824 type:complete len:119 (+) Transcript_19460:76-432(+)|eukprot:CAMPEP_0171451920 /NCGR_PEP_ID=MMETSP0945-20130129/231_1 /TAXON_ID=109269 /ORGANISM="Vaucheria litorea, Strain CCMP2940" /LENGTH=118 /DNA_ID=CAMNT_0011976475 /DNA_START=52 /DNA_END=408 /DNA_ORIENTATION=-